MNSSANKIFSCRKASFYKALTFALAITVLVFSCPLKRLLQSDFISNNSNAAKTNQTKISQRTSSDYSVTDNCSLTAKKIVLAKEDLSQQHQLPVPLYFSTINVQAGFDINYFLSGISYSRTPSVFARHSALPLFLQHLRLLI